jgi:diguanylate cyclase
MNSLETVLFIISLLLIGCCTANYFKNKQLKTNVNTDFLTGMYNRKILPQIELLEKNGNQFYIIACDIDHFKRVNDNYGHSAGDLVLKTVSETIKGLFKSNIDYTVRFGGEEFFIFMQANEDTKQKIFDRTETIRQKIEELHILTEDMKLIKITASFGICIDLTKPIKNRIDMADKNLYKAKESGRNKIIS